MANTFLILSLTFIMIVDLVTTKDNNTMDNNTTEPSGILSQEHPLKVLSNSMVPSTNTREIGAFDGIVQFEKILANEKAKLLSTPQELTDHKAAERTPSSFSESPRPSGNCSSDIQYVIEGVRKRLNWALEMMDSTGKPTPGTLQGNDIFVGDFDQCLDVDTGMDFDGQYCTTIVVISEVLNTTLVPPLQFALGVCFPSSCESKDVEYNINDYFQRNPDLSAVALQTNCQKRHLHLTTKAKVVICICSFFVALMAVGTFYDAVYKRWWLERQNTSSNQTSRQPKGSNKVGQSEHDPIIDRQLQKSKLYSSNETALNEKPSPFYDTCDQVLMSFSVYTNTASLFTINQSQGSIDCIHGMKFISMLWIIIFHTYTLITGTVENVSPFLDDSYSDWTFMPIIRAACAVDTFFAMSGLLLAYVTLKKLTKEKVTAKFFGEFYLHRYLRLTPPYMLVLMTYVPLFKYFSKGPFWPQGGIELDECEETWWTNLLYLNNFVKTEKICMLWSWYLANDLQFYLVSPLIFVPMIFYEWRGLIVSFAFVVGSAICAGVITSAKDIPVFVGLNLEGAIGQEQFDYIKYYYVKPYARIAPFVIGMVTGFLLAKSGCKARLSKLVVILGWLVSTVLALAVVYGLYDNFTEDRPSKEIRSLYHALYNIAWGISVCWVVFACANGYGGIVNTFLSWKAFIPLSRLTYCAYLVHPVVIKFYFYSQRKPLYLNYLNISFTFAGIAVMSYGIAYIAYMAYEVPVTGLEKVIRGQKKKK